MYDELVKRLNAYSAEHERHGGITAEAADAIEELSKDLDSWKATAKVEREAYWHWFDQYQKDVPRWIPVTERLPSKGTNVLVLEFGRVEQAYTTTYTADRSLCWVVINGGSYHRISDADCPIKWWMPLPQPPKEE